MHPLNKKVKFMKDSIDFGSMEIPKLFRKLLIPTVLGMVFSAVFVITDGIFVGQGIGSDALAAVNITAPLFLISTGIGLMFGVGASVVASIHLSQGKLKTARINVTQAVVVSSLFLAVLWGVVCLFAPQVAVWLGSSERLLPLAVEYMYWFLPFLVFSALLSSGMFFVRLDGSPNYAMLCNAIPAVVNILLDYVFIFILKWGMMGAALATSLGYILGVIPVCRIKCIRNPDAVPTQRICRHLLYNDSSFLTSLRQGKRNIIFNAVCSQTHIHIGICGAPSIQPYQSFLAALLFQYVG